jgi:hypothetical protein
MLLKRFGPTPGKEGKKKIEEGLHNPASATR